MWIRLSWPRVWDAGFCQNVIISVLWLAAARPVARLRREIRTGAGVYIGRDVECLLCGELLRPIDRHKAMNERRCRIDSRHTGPDVVRMRSPERRRQRRALPIRAVAPAACARENAGTAPGVALERLKTGESLSIHLDPDRHSARKKCEIGHDVSHFSSRGSQRRPVHATAEAVVDSVLDQIDFAAPCAILRVTREGTDPRHCVAAQSAIEMATRTAQGITNVMRYTVARREQKGAPSERRCAVRAVLELALGRNAKWHSRCRGLLRERGRFRVNDRPSDCPDNQCANDGYSSMDPASQDFLREWRTEGGIASVRGPTDLGGNAN